MEVMNVVYCSLLSSTQRKLFILHIEKLKTENNLQKSSKFNVLLVQNLSITCASYRFRFVELFYHSRMFSFIHCNFAGFSIFLCLLFLYLSHTHAQHESMYIVYLYLSSACELYLLSAESIKSITTNYGVLCLLRVATVYVQSFAVETVNGVRKHILNLRLNFIVQAMCVLCVRRTSHITIKYVFRFVRGGKAEEKLILTYTNSPFQQCTSPNAERAKCEVECDGMGRGRKRLGVKGRRSCGKCKMLLFCLGFDRRRARSLCNSHAYLMRTGTTRVETKTRIEKKNTTIQHGTEIRALLRT